MKMTGRIMSKLLKLHQNIFHAGGYHFEYPEIWDDGNDMKKALRLWKISSTAKGFSNRLYHRD